MNNFTPLQAASLSDDVYALTQFSSIDEALLFLKKKYNDQFTFEEDKLLKAKTGGPWFIKCRTAFGFTLLGKGKFQGHAVFLFRGTQYLADWLTNLNVGVSRCASSQPVHDGFNLAFKTMLPKLSEFMNVIIKNKITHIHCVGHSLGGALATLCADWIKSNYDRSTFTYTYGSPRVGLIGFSSRFTSSIGADRIFRAYHKTDIVPCIPIWPFLHVPFQGQDYYLPSPGVIPMAEYHSIKLYIESVRSQNWESLAALRPEQKTQSGLIQWLSIQSPIGITITTLEWLNRALIYVLEKCANGAAWIISEGFTNSFTLMDQLAYILTKGINLAENTSNLVLQLIKKIMTMLGMKKVVKAEEVTREFIRNILLRLQARVNEFTKSVLNKTLVEGRAV